MNYRLIARYLGYFSAATGFAMLACGTWALWYGEGRALLSLVSAAAIAVSVGGAFVWLGRKADLRMLERETLAVVSLSWFIAAGFGSLPFIFSGLLEPVDAFFETMSGFTTTGSTVLQNIELAPNSLLFWRSFTQWLGGIGIVVLFIAVLPYLGAGGKQLFKSEAPGPDPRGLRPHIRDTAKLLFRIYLGLTLLETVALMIAGLSLFEALTHTMSTLSTGGFSPRQDSIAAYASTPAVEFIILVFMIFAGTNFALLYGLVSRSIRSPFRDAEWRLYIGILIAATIVVGTNLTGDSIELEDGGETVTYSMAHAFRAASFQVTSIMTGTGFATENFDAWPALSRMLLFVMMFFGGCAGSTTGGIKIIRLIVLAKLIYWHIERTFRPKTIRAVRVGDEVVSDVMQSRVLTFFAMYLAWFAFGCLYISALGVPLETAASSVAATLNLVGPGLAQVGPALDYSMLPDSGKLFLALSMVMGRLEMLAVCVLFFPSFWRR